jgi:hypothetical protein
MSLRRFRGFRRLLFRQSSRRDASDNGVIPYPVDLRRTGQWEAFLALGTSRGACIVIAGAAFGSGV